MSRERRKWPELRGFHFPVSVANVGVLDRVRVRDSAEVEKLGAGGGRVPELACFDGSFGIAAEREEVSVGTENFGCWGGRRVPLAAVTDEGRDGDDECGSENGGESDGKKFVGGGIGFWGVRENEGGDIGRKGGKGDRRRRRRRRRV